MKKYFLLILLILTSVLYATESARVARERAIVRNGPGSFYKILAELENGSSFQIIKKKNGWLNIRKQELEGYVSKKVTDKRDVPEDIFSKMGKQKTDLKVSQHGMSAGVKGFAQKFTKKFDGSPEFLGLYLQQQLNVKEYKRFKRETYLSSDNRKNLKKFLLPKPKVRDYFTFPEEGMGIGIASHISSLGIYKNEELRQYVNQVGNIVVEATNVYDINYKFFILDIDEPNAYSCPGGIVFITLGMLKMIETEAELACVLAHEIAHVARHHGMLEMEKRKHHIMAERSYDDMENEITSMGFKQDDEMLQVEQELEKISFEIFETIIHGRLEAYERNADELAILYTLRAGYDVRQLLSLLHRLKHASTRSNNKHYTQDQIAERIIRIEKKLDKLTLSRNLFDHAARWNRITGF